MSGRLNILALVSDAFGGRGGIAQYNRDLFGALARTGLFSAITVLPRCADNAVAIPPGISQQPARRSRLAYVMAALRHALFQPVDIVFCGHINLAPLAGFIARLRGARLVFQMHGVEVWSRPDEMHRSAVESADLVLCVSRDTRACVLGWAAIAPERVIVLPNTVAEIFSPGEADALRRKWGVDGKFVLLTVARMDARERYKGHDRVIRALPGLVAAGRDIVYVVLGDGDDMNRLKNLATELGVADRVRFLGAADRDVLIEAYRVAGLFVMPSSGEGFGIAFLEAMASGTPALGLNAGGARDALGDGELGAVVAEEELALVLARMIDAPKPDPLLLAAAVQARFGRARFEAGTRAAMARLLEAA